MRNRKKYRLFSLERFYPERVENSTYRIDFEELYRKGYRGVIFDIDNTLVPHGAPATKEAVRFFKKLRRIGFRTCLLSNNRKARVVPFAEAVGSDYIELSESLRENGCHHGRGGFCGRSAVYGRVRGETCRHIPDPGKTHTPERRDPDRPETETGEDRSFLLHAGEKQQK